MELSEIIQSKIQDEGPITFQEFMEMSLYYPRLGYYTFENNLHETKNDYYTSPHLTPLFGIMIGRQLEEMWEAMGKEPFSIVEYGGGTGKLCYDILDYVKSNPDFYEKTTYHIIEKRRIVQDKE